MLKCHGIAGGVCLSTAGTLVLEPIKHGLDVVNGQALVHPGECCDGV
jgi:hypothetical protein